MLDILRNSHLQRASGHLMQLCAFHIKKQGSQEVALPRNRPASICTHLGGGAGTQLAPAAVRKPGQRAEPGRKDVQRRVSWRYSDCGRLQHFCVPSNTMPLTLQSIQTQQRSTPLAASSRSELWWKVMNPSPQWHAGRLTVRQMSRCTPVTDCRQDVRSCTAARCRRASLANACSQLRWSGIM
jgi:hypothetical protein